jgi:hypothetical protein
LRGTSAWDAEIFFFMITILGPIRAFISYIELSAGLFKNISSSSPIKQITKISFLCKFAHTSYYTNLCSLAKYFLSSNFDIQILTVCNIVAQEQKGKGLEIEMERLENYWSIHF